MFGDRFTAPYKLIWEGINNGLREFCQEEGHLLLGELPEVVADAEKPSRLMPHITYDGAHFNHRGYEMLGKAMAEELRSEVKKGDVVVTLESVKATSDVYSPVAGRVTAVNSALESGPQKINEDPYGEGWLVELEVSDPAPLEGLMDFGAYEKFLAGPGE